MIFVFSSLRISILTPIVSFANIETERFFNEDFTPSTLFVFCETLEMTDCECVSRPYESGVRSSSADS